MIGGREDSPEFPECGERYMAVATQSVHPTARRTPVRQTLYITAPFEELAERIRRVLADAEISFRVPHPGILGVDLLPRTLERLGHELGHYLSTHTLRECPALILEDGAMPSLPDLARMQPLSTVLAPAQYAWLTEVITKGRLTSYFQPIVHMSSPTDVFAYECLLRGHRVDGALIAPSTIFDGARLAGWLPELDRIARGTALRSAVAQAVTAPIFINMLPTTVASPAHQLATIRQELASVSIPREQVVFEIVETEQVEQLHLLQQIVAEYRKEGFRIALDDVGAGYNSLNLLACLRPDLIKLDVELVRDVHRDSFKGQIAAKLLEAARNLGVLTIAEGVENEDEWRWLLSHGADYGQGFAFAQPAATPPRPRVPRGSFLHGVPSRA